MLSSGQCWRASTRTVLSGGQCWRLRADGSKLVPNDPQMTGSAVRRGASAHAYACADHYKGDGGWWLAVSAVSKRVDAHSRMALAAAAAGQRQGASRYSRAIARPAIYPRCSCQYVLTAHVDIADAHRGDVRLVVALQSVPDECAYHKPHKHVAHQ